jgi:hypothetical protein
MGIATIPAPSAASKTMFRTTLTSGTSYTVPAGVTYLNVTLYGGGGGAGGGGGSIDGKTGRGGQIISSTLSATAGGSIAYAIGAGGLGSATAYAGGSSGGTTTFTGATSATGGAGGIGDNSVNGPAGTVGDGAANGGTPGGNNGPGNGGAGGIGKIEVEYWAAIAGAELLAGRFAHRSNYSRSVGDLSISESLGTSAAEFRELARTLQAQRDSLFPPSIKINAQAIIATSKKVVEEYKSDFYTGIHDYTV